MSAPNGSTTNNERETQDAGTSVQTPHMRSYQRDNALTYHPTDGVGSTPRARSMSRVRFDLGANEMHSPEAAKKKATDERFSDSEVTGDRKRRHRRRKHRGESSRDSPQLMNDKYERPPSGVHRDDESDGTVELPERFDENGNRKGESSDPLEQLIGNLASRFLGGGGGGEEQGGDRDSRSGRRRHRH